MISRRNALALMSSMVLTPQALAQGAPKPMRGVMPIVVTPYTPGGAVDYEDIARQMVFYDPADAPAAPGRKAMATCCCSARTSGSRA